MGIEVAIAMGVVGIVIVGVVGIGIGNYFFTAIIGSLADMCFEKNSDIFIGDYEGKMLRNMGRWVWVANHIKGTMQFSLGF